MSCSDAVYESTERILQLGQFMCSRFIRVGKLVLSDILTRITNTSEKKLKLFPRFLSNSPNGWKSSVYSVSIES